MSTLYSRNILPSSIIVSGYSVYSVDSSNIEMVDVQDNNSHKYRSFKYVINNTSYYYVVDGIHNVWINDLSSIGYSEVPSVILPTVDTTNDSYHRFKFATNGSDYTFGVNSTTSVYRDVSTSSPQPQWDSTKVYSVIRYWNTDETQVGRLGITPREAPSWGEAGTIYMTNNSGSSITVAKIRIATCSDLSATVVTVYDSSNNAFNSFKFTANTNYYYVLDGTQADWTDDLSSIGYSLTPSVILPTVSIDLLYSNKDKSTQMKISSTIGVFWYDNNSANVIYQSGWTYLLIKYYTWTGDDTGSTDNIEYCYFEDRSGNLFTGSRIPNYGHINVQRAEIASCSDSMATIVTVYDSQNTIYKAFKFTVNGTDYYYILDGIQADWTDDLSSIGYNLAKKAYLTTSPHSDKYLSEYVQYSIVDENNNHIPYDSSRSYILTGTYKVSGSVVIGNVSLTSGDDGYGTAILKLYNGSPRVEVGYVEYMVS